MKADCILMRLKDFQGKHSRGLGDILDRYRISNDQKGGFLIPTHVIIGMIHPNCHGPKICTI